MADAQPQPRLPIRHLSASVASTSAQEASAQPTSDASTLPVLSVHHLPIGIDHTGEAEIEKYFHVTPLHSKAEGTADVEKKARQDSIDGGATSQESSGESSGKIDQASNGKSEEEDIVRSSIRGRVFLGKRQRLPEGYTGIVLSRSVEAKAGEAASTVGVFSHLTHWKREVAPNANDAIHRWLQWPAIAHAIHEPIPLEEGKRKAEDAAGDNSPAKRKKIE
eukprot:TRINITY_DN23340_c0_g1_i1.p2 TRINITY_DN23340_c0_g1~~TRINITY_DN23340_c0_g1_i1.p2  ORF type:complete len:221 (-),score=61.47 TRINITY_DN23340_c0_g1_i1:346-1008(-)